MFNIPKIFKMYNPNLILIVLEMNPNFATTAYKSSIIGNF